MALVSPSESVMPVVLAVSVSPTRAVPVMVGAFCGPGTRIASATDSILPSPVQMAPWAAQSMVGGSVTMTSSFPDGCTVISHLRFLPVSSWLTSVTVPPITARAWSSRVESVTPSAGASLKRSSKVKAALPSWDSGVSWVLAVNRDTGAAATGAVPPLVNDS